MTREEAISQIRDNIDFRKRLQEGDKPQFFDAEENEKDIEAFETAIKALSAESCDDAISRQAAIDTLDNTDKFMDEDRTVENYKELLKECYEVLPSVTPKQRWIPVSERLPEPYGQVLRTVKSIGWNGTFSIYVDIGTICPIDTDVIAWMPLPVPMIPEQYRAESEIHWNCTDAEIAKSFIEDVEAVKELLPQAESEDTE